MSELLTIEHLFGFGIDKPDERIDGTLKIFNAVVKMVCIPVLEHQRTS